MKNGSIVGSYVAKRTEQVEILTRTSGTEDIRNASLRECINVARSSKGNRDKIIDLIRRLRER